jgi:hypothetical protein
MTFTIEEERGIYDRTPHPHNGYYAGDFSGRTERPTAWATALAMTTYPVQRKLP